MKRLLIAGAALVVLAAGTWLIAGFEDDPLEGRRDRTSAHRDDDRTREVRRRRY